MKKKGERYAPISTLDFSGAPQKLKHRFSRGLLFLSRCVAQSSLGSLAEPLLLLRTLPFASRVCCIARLRYLESIALRPPFFPTPPPIFPSDHGLNPLSCLIWMLPLPPTTIYSTYLHNLLTSTFWRTHSLEGCSLFRQTPPPHHQHASGPACFHLLRRGGTSPWNMLAKFSESRVGSSV